MFDNNDASIFSICDGGKFVCSKVNHDSLTTAESPCKNNSVYEKCVANCPLTCENMNNPPACSSTNCKDGCECIPGFVLDGDKCVNTSMCPCFHAGKAFYEGETYIQDCNEW